MSVWLANPMPKSRFSPFLCSYAETVIPFILSAQPRSRAAQRHALRRADIPESSKGTEWKGSGCRSSSHQRAAFCVLIPIAAMAGRKSTTLDAGLPRTRDLRERPHCGSSRVYLLVILRSAHSHDNAFGVFAVSAPAAQGWMSCFAGGRIAEAEKQMVQGRNS